MSSTPDFKRHDAGSYDGVVDSFDRFTESYTTPLAEHMLSLARVAPGDAVLDVGTGTAVVAFLAARAARQGEEVNVLGVDLSEGMLATSQRKEAELGTGARFEKMDAEHLELEDASFDAVLSLFALTHFPDPQRSLAEMFRVLKPGGRLVVAAGSGPPAGSLAGWRHRLGKLGDRLLEPLGKRLIAPRSLLGWLRARGALKAEEGHGHSGWAQQHGNRSAILPRWTEEAGFQAVATDWMGCRAVLERAEDFWELQATNSSTLRKCLALHSSEELASLRERYLEHCAAVLAKGGKLVYPYGAVFISAEKSR